MQSPEKSNISRPSPAQRRKSIRYAYLVAIFMSTGSLCLFGPPFQLFVIKLGCSNFYLGLVNFLIHAAGLFGIFAIRVIAKHGKVNCLRVCRACGLTICLAIGLSAFLASADSKYYELILTAIIPVLLLRSMFSGIGGSGWFPLLQDNVPPQIRGRFFASFRTSWQIAVLIANLCLIFVLGKDAGFVRIGLVLLFGNFIMLYSVQFLKHMYEAPRQPDNGKTSVSQQFKETIKAPGIRRFLIYIVTYNFATFASVAFQIKYMKQLGYSDAHVIAITAVISGGAVLSLRFWGRIADRYGNRSLFSLSHIGVSVSFFVWIFVGNSPVWFIVILAAVAAYSIFHHGNGIAQTRYMLGAVPTDKQGIIIIINIFMTLSVAVAPLLGGLFLLLTDGLNLSGKSWHINHYQMLFFLSSLMMVIPHKMRKGFRISSEAPTSHVLLLLQRPALNRLGQFIRIIDSPVKDKDESNKDSAR